MTKEVSLEVSPKSPYTNPISYVQQCLRIERRIEAFSKNQDKDVEKGVFRIIRQSIPLQVDIAQVVVDKSLVLST